MSAECASPLLGSLVSLGGVALGGLIGFLSATRVSDRNARATAAAKFRASLAPALAVLVAASHEHRDQSDRTDPSAFLKANFLAHASAIEEFRPFVVAPKRAYFQRAWEQYCELEPSRWTGGAEFIAEHLNPEAPLKLVRARIEALLKFSET